MSYVIICVNPDVTASLFNCMNNVFLLQDNLWKNGLNDRINQDAIRAFDMAFIIGQKSYEGYEYYDFFEQVFLRLKGQPFWSNLTSEREVMVHHRQRKSHVIPMGENGYQSICFSVFLTF